MNAINMHVYEHQSKRNLITYSEKGRPIKSFKRIPLRHYYCTSLLLFTKKDEYVMRLKRGKLLTGGVLAWIPPYF